MMTEDTGAGRLAGLTGGEFASRCDIDDRTRSHVLPRAILWQSGEPGAVQNAAALLRNNSGQISIGKQDICVLNNRGGGAGLLLDFGIELHGGIRILAHSLGEACACFRLRVRFGESAMEAMSELNDGANATNDHAVRDSIFDVSSLGGTEIGGTGFRFARIDLVDEGSIGIEEARAVFVYRDVECKGSFECSDPLINEIWRTGAYTVFLNMQNYLWDGVKRDRMVWIGDMHPEVSTIQAVFGHDPIVPKSLDFVRDTTALPLWMNDIPSYSMWWVMIHYSWYMQNGDIGYLRQQKDYLLPLLEQLASSVDEGGRSCPEGRRFLDWPSSANPLAVDAGVQALHAMCMETGALLCRCLGEFGLACAYDAVALRLKTCRKDPAGSKQAAALLALAGMEDAAAVNGGILAADGAHRLSSFLGYYVLQARALAGDTAGCLGNIRDYWGGMLSLGATSFWEDFDIDWLRNASRIDELTADDCVDVHGTYGSYCYRGYRHSLCHGWASGPTAWLSQHVLGVRIASPGCREVKILPALGDLEWVNGVYPTPFGAIRVSHEKRSDGSVRTTVEKPDEVKLIQ